MSPQRPGYRQDWHRGSKRPQQIQRTVGEQRGYQAEAAHQGEEHRDREDRANAAASADSDT